MNTYTPGSSVTVLAPPVTIAGVSTNVSGVVGTANKGPVNVPTAITGTNYQSVFGVPQARKYDAGTVIAAGALNGLATTYVVRVTDGTDRTANATLSNSSITSINTGSGWNGATVTLASGGRANSITVTVAAPNTPTELFMNLPATNAAVFWAAFDAALNSGANVPRDASNIVRSNSVAATVLPSLPTSVTLAGGTDGATTIAGSTLVGSNGGTAPTGMYALAGLGVQYAVLADCDDSTTWTTQAAFGATNFIMMVETLPASTTVATAVATKQSAGLDSFEAVLLQGDWPSYNDPNLGAPRVISPQGYYLGLRASLQPNQSVLNKTMDGIVTTQRLASGAPYQTSDTETLFGAGIDVITNPIPRGASFGVAGGYNSSSNAGTNSDAYTTMTNFLAQTFRKAGGPWVGEGNSAANRLAVAASFNHFLQGLVTAGLLDAGSFNVSVNATQDQIALGYLNVVVNVQYQGIIRFFNVSLQGGAGVVITSNAA